MTKKAFILLAAGVLIVSGLLPLEQAAADGFKGKTYAPLVQPDADEIPLAQQKVSPLGNFVINVPWRTIDVVCDGEVNPAEWSDAARYDISDTSGQGEVPSLDGAQIQR